MTLARALLIAFLLSCLAAGIVAVVSRTPASVRAMESGVDGSADTFTEVQIARHGAYRGPLYLAFGLGLIAEIALFVLLRGAAMDQLTRWMAGIPGGWPARAAATGAAVAASIVVVALPLGYVRGYALQKAWRLSNQDLSAWGLDQVKGAVISVVITTIASVAFFGIVRWQPRWWWLWGAGTFTVLTAVLVFLYPVLIAPLFNRFTPLEDAALSQRIEVVARRAGVDVDRVLVADASTRSSAENAYVAGLGATKQVVLYDTLIAGHDDDETMFVVAHELGHEAEGHVLKGIAVSAVGLLIGFGALAWLVGSGKLLEWAGVTSLTDLRVVPALLLFALVAGVVLQPAQNAVSRSFEATADAIAFDLTGDPVPAVRAFHRLALANIADLNPPPLAVWMFYSHPPISSRIKAAKASGAFRP